MKHKIKLKKEFKITIIIILAIIFLLAISLLCIKLTKKEEQHINEQEYQQEEVKQEEPELKKVTVVDLDSNDRPYAVMINNHYHARAHHAGLQEAYVIYELIVEGGITRYLALYQNPTVEKIGSVRSSRHYYLDYALENDAIYVHWGWSPQAQSDISTLKINNINGLTWEGKYFYRDKSLNVPLEHTGFTTSNMLKDAANRLKYRTTTEEKTLLNYTVEENDLSKFKESKKAEQITIKYSNSITDKYIYDEDNKVYKRYVNDKEHVDDVTKKQYTFKNIITYQVHNATIAGDEKGRQEYNNIGTGTGYYISEGYAIEIKWEKKTREGKTKYMYLDGTELKVNDGNTFIQIQPKNQKLTIE